jgi:putative endonuclease
MPKILSPKLLGQYGENIAKEFLKKQGYEIVLTNFTCRLGRNFSGKPLFGEIDIVAYDNDLLCFIEVKTRSTNFLPPEQAINLQKQRQLTRLATRYKQIFQIIDSYRFDAVAILVEQDKLPLLRLEKNFFQPKIKNYYSWERK